MKISRLTIALLIFSTALMFSCKKNHDTDATDTDVTGAQDNALAENTSNDVEAIGSQAADGGSLVTARLGSGTDYVLSCATVTDTNKKVTVTFNGSTCFDGRIRNGSITFDFSQSAANSIHYRDPGFKCVVSFNNYTVDGNQISNSSSHTIENTTNGSNPTGYNPSSANETWHITANMTITKSSGGTVSWNCDRTKTLLNTTATCPAGDFTSFPVSDTVPIDWKNAKVGITGSANGTRANGETFTVTVTSQLVRDFGACSVSGRHPFILGTLDFAPSGKLVRHVDYGYSPSGPSGGCDDWMSVTINSRVFYAQHK